MARAIATITGTALAPGVSRNKRLYTKEAIGKMVTRASERIAAGKRPIAMYTSHDSVDVADIGGVLTGIWQEDDGSARYSADIPDTPTGRAVAALVDPQGGSQFLRGVSILGNWVGGQRHETAGGQAVETGSDFELGRLDLVSSPGVDSAGVDTLQAAIGDGEALAQYTIAESAPEALVTTVTEETGTQPVAESASEQAPRPEVADDVREAVRAVFAPAEAHVLEDGLCITCGGVEEAKRTRNKTPYGAGANYADPGYQKDGVKRYPLDTASHIRAAYSYFSMPKNAAKYTAAQAKRIMGKIRAAMKRIGAKLSAESDVVAGFVIGEAMETPGSVLEWVGEDPQRSGSWSVSACNGPVSLNLSSYCMDPADLDVIIRAAADAACTALKRLDPDMDGDVDVPGASSGDTDGDGGHESAPAEDVTENSPATEDEPAGAGEEDAPAGETSEAGQGPGETPAAEREPDKETEAPVTTEATTNPGGSAPSTITEADVAKAVAEALEAHEKARKERKAAKRAAQPAAETAPAAPVTESADERETRLIAAALKAAGVQPAVQETEEEKVARLVREGVTGFIQEAIASGAVIPGRAGLQVREHATDPDEAPDAKALAAMSDDDFMAFGGANLDKYMGDNTRHSALHA